MLKKGKANSKATTESKEAEITAYRDLPVLPLKEVVLYPKMVLPLMVGDKNSIRLIDDALVKDKTIAMVAIKEGEVEEVKPETLFGIGTSAVILKMVKISEDLVRLLVQGVNRIQIEGYVQTTPYLRANATVLEDKGKRNMEIDALIVSIKGLFQKALELAPHLPSEVGVIVMNIDDPSTLADLIASNLNITVVEKQGVLEALDIKARLEKVYQLLNKEFQILELGSKIQNQLKSEMDKTQRDYYLREQLKAIQKELGETDERTVEIEELRQKIKEVKMTGEVEKEANKELDRLARIPPAAAEYTVARTYIDWLIEIPWSKSTEDNLDISVAQKVLDEDHYDLEKVKKRILEYLAVRKLKSDMKGPILCFVGPPGTGKTSLGKSIARALGRKFIRISLGGIRDEAEIRGHRRTYVGALPGRIIQGIRKCGFKNPVFMLDEVDKLGMDFRGDPSSALLEVLDPEQNYSFSDHYLEVPFDLSRVMFITTANILDPIPPALKDRMEVLDLTGYTDDEKLVITRKYLIPRQVEAHGLKAEKISFTDEAIRKIIQDYTREAGLRNLEREIASVCRAIAKEVAEGRDQMVSVVPEMIHSFLGATRFHPEVAERISEPGVSTGLAWTPTGGDIIFIEATKMRGKQSLILTGQLGDVMKESAQAALSYVRSKALELGIPEDFFSNFDIHLHVPAGAIPKDGPSAGVAMFTALVSLFTDRPVKADVAMTGEITLRGRVLPVGGIKEKVLAAKRAGIKTVILPKENENNLEEIPPQIKEGMKFVLVEEMGEVLMHALSGEEVQV
ncbi:MAG TPA: endopeptidase La [Thermodesulfobacteriota bacterium]|nr:endopeptidase La [Thermodesulfobacteriota bacterium]